ncbi:MAG: CRISPR-associated DxTHG motif protein [Chitinophagales bacterium]
MGVTHGFRFMTTSPPWV